jgi:phage-related protein (TIGR01555 family)
LGVESWAGGVGSPGFSEQITQPTTIFRNMRFYLVSNFRQMLSEAYVEIPLIQTIVDIPVDDALRGGVEIKTKQLSDEQIYELTAFMERKKDMKTAGQGCKWNRLFGGGGIIVICGQDPSTPLDVDALANDPYLEFRAVDMWELFWSKQNTTDYATAIDAPQSQLTEFYDYYGEQLHHSRVLLMTGIEAPSFVRPRLRGWGVSIVETLVMSINQYLKATDLAFEVLDEFKLDVFKIKNLANTLLAPGGTEIIQRRVTIANMQKNFKNALTMDAEDDFDHKQLSFSGLAEVMDGIRMQVASAMRMPLTKLFGISAAGFNSGEDDIENYNAMVEGQVREKVKFEILRMIELRSMQLFGIIPTDMSIDFKPLRILSSEQEENVKTQKFNRLLAAKQAGELTTEEFRNACNKDALLSVNLEGEVDPSELEDTSDDTGEDEETETVGPVAAAKSKLKSKEAKA